MTDHRPEVRECLKELMDCVVTTYEDIATKELKPEYVGTHRVWCGDKSCWLYPGDVICEVDGALVAKARAALSAPPIEHPSLREALKATLHALNVIAYEKYPVREDESYDDALHRYCLKVYEKNKPSLAASPQPVVDEVVEVSQLGFCSARLRDMGLTSNSRLRVVGWREPNE